VNLVLIGYRGTGKSTIGHLVAENLERPLVSLDDEIARRAGCSIPAIVREHSWDYFRDLESQLVAEFAAADGLVLDTGGGVVTRPSNVELLRGSGILFLLQASVSDIVSRIGGGTERPSLTGKKSFTEEVEEVLAVRRPLYQAAAHFVIDTSLYTAEQAALEIVATFKTALDH
jgi:shikimate kinase